MPRPNDPSIFMAATVQSGELTSSVQQALRNAIAADPVLAAVPNTLDGGNEIAGVLNQPAVPDYFVWRTSVPSAEIYGATTPAPDNTAWSWTAFIGRSQGERDAWREMLSGGTLDPSLASVRAGIADIFSGTSGTAQRTHLTVLGRRRSTRAEKILAVATVGGVGARGSTANPDTLTFEGMLSYTDVFNARIAT
jgi:hypothetical protein